MAGSEGSLVWFVSAATVAILVALFTRQRGWGMALPVLGVGVLVGLIPGGLAAPPDPEVILLAILAPLVFGESLGSSYLDIRKVSRPVLVLAVGLVIVTTLAVGGLMVWVTAVPLALAMALGAVLAPTDVVAVSNVARSASLPRRLVSILEGESLVNDGTGLTVLKVATIAAVAGGLTFGEISTTFVLAVVCGVAVGLVGGWLLTWISVRSKDAVAANSLTLVAPLVLYLVAERIQGSGILAVVVAAVYLAHAQTSGIKRTGRVQGVALWRHVTFVLQAMAFFLVGMELVDTIEELSATHVSMLVILVVLVTATLIVTRMVFVAIMAKVGSMRGQLKFDGRQLILAGWAGARGPVSGMAAFTIPVAMANGDPMPYRSLILATTFGVIVVTLILSQTLAPLAKLLKIQGEDESAELARVEAALAHAALRRLETEEETAALRGEPIPAEISRALRAEMDNRLARIDEQPEEPITDVRSVRTDLERMMVRAEQEEILRIRSDEGLPDAIVRPILHRLDVQAMSLESPKGGEGH